MGENLAGGVSAFSNAVIDAFAHLGVTHAHTAFLRRACHDHGLTGPLAAE